MTVKNTMVELLFPCGDCKGTGWVKPSPASDRKCTCFGGYRKQLVTLVEFKEHMKRAVSIEDAKPDDGTSRVDIGLST